VGVAAGTASRRFQFCRLAALMPCSVQKIACVWPLAARFSTKRCHSSRLRRGRRFPDSPIEHAPLSSNTGAHYGSENHLGRTLRFERLRHAVRLGAADDPELCGVLFEAATGRPSSDNKTLMPRAIMGDLVDS
jgi:hypothetical protein